MTATTPQGGRFLRTIPETDASALIGRVEAAHAALPATVPGCRCILPAWLWRIEAAGYRVTFASIDGAPLIVAGEHRPATPAKRKAGKAA